VRSWLVRPVGVGILEARGSCEAPLLHSHSSEYSGQFTKPVLYMPARETDNGRIVEALTRVIGLAYLVVGLFR